MIFAPAVGIFIGTIIIEVHGAYFSKLKDSPSLGSVYFLVYMFFGYLVALAATLCIGLPLHMTLRSNPITDTVTVYAIVGTVVGWVIMCVFFGVTDVFKTSTELLYFSFLSGAPPGLLTAILARLIVGRSAKI